MNGAAPGLEAGARRPNLLVRHNSADRSIAIIMAAGVALSPYTTWRIHPDFLFTVADALFVIATLALLTRIRAEPFPLRTVAALWLAGLTLLVLGLFVGSIVNGNAGRWTIVAAQYFFTFVVLPLLLLHGGLPSAERNATALVLGVAAMQLFGTIVYWIGIDYALAQRISHNFITGANRLGGFMADANWNAAMISLTFPFVLFLAKTGRVGGLVMVVAAAAMVSGLLLSGSFTGFVTTAVGTALFLLVAGGKWAVRVVLLTAAGLLVASAFGARPPAVFEQRVQGALVQGDLSQAGTYIGRAELITEAWEVVEHTSLIGLGADEYRAHSTHAAPVHNTYLLIWAEGGLFAMLGWLVIVLIPVGVAIRTFAVDRTASALCLAVAASFLIFSTASPHLYARCWAIPLVLATLIALYARDRAELARSAYLFRIRSDPKVSSHAFPR